MDDVLASALAKLAKTEHPIAVHRHKYLAASLRKEAEQLKRAVEDGEAILKQSAIELPAFLPFKAFFAWLLRPFTKAKIVRRSKSLDVVKAKLAELQDALDNSNKTIVSGILTPLTLQDEAVCRAYYFQTRRHLEASLPQVIDEDGQKAREQAIDFTSDSYLNAKRVELALKRSKDDRGQQILEEPVARLLTQKEAHELDPRLTAEIWREYMVAFELTEDELGKS